MAYQQPMHVLAGATFTHRQPDHSHMFQRIFQAPMPFKLLSRHQLRFRAVYAVFSAGLLQKCGNLTTARPRRFTTSHDRLLQLTCKHTRAHWLDFKNRHFVGMTDHTVRMCTALAVHPELQLPPKCPVLASGALICPKSATWQLPTGVGRLLTEGLPVWTHWAPILHSSARGGAK